MGMLGDLVPKRHLFRGDQTKNISSPHCSSIVIVRLGLYLFDLPAGLGSVARWEKQLGHPVQLLSIYQAWESKYRNFYARELRDIHRLGRTALITWEPWELPLPGKSQQDQPC